MKIGVYLLAIAGLVPTTSLAAEYHRDEEIAPESAEDVYAPMHDTIRRPAPLRRIFAPRLESASPFWRDLGGRLRFRLYDFEREDGDSTLSQAIAGGTELEISTGRWKTNGGQLARTRALGHRGAGIPSRSGIFCEN